VHASLESAPPSHFTVSVNVVVAVVFAGSLPVALSVTVYEPTVVPGSLVGGVDDPPPPPPHATTPHIDMSAEKVRNTPHRRRRGTAIRIRASSAPVPVQIPGRRNGWTIALDDAVVLMTTVVLAAGALAVNVTD
jgi:hypothetical protein